MTFSIPFVELHYGHITPDHFTQTSTNWGTMGLACLCYLDVGQGFNKEAPVTLKWIRIMHS